MQSPNQGHRQNQNDKVRHYIDGTEDEELETQVHAPRLHRRIPDRVDRQTLQQIDHCRRQAVSRHEGASDVQDYDEGPNRKEALIEQKDRELCREDGREV